MTTKTKIVNGRATEVVETDPVDKVTTLVVSVVFTSAAMLILAVATLAVVELYRWAL